MAPINIKEIIKFSSEDLKYPATNLIKGMKWMTSKQNQNEQAFVEFAIESSTQIHYIDLGHCNVAEIEVQVASSSSKLEQGFSTILPTVILQTSQDVRAGLNKNGCKMFNFKEHFFQDSAQEKWDVIKLVLRQPHARNKQMGIDFVRIGSLNNSKKKKIVEKQASELFENSSHEWKASPLAKLFSSNEKSITSIKNLESKLQRIATNSTSKDNCYSRTAQMVLSSKIAMVKANKTVNPTAKHEFEEEIVLKNTSKKKEQLLTSNDIFKSRKSSNFLGNVLPVELDEEKTKKARHVEISNQQMTKHRNIEAEKMGKKQKAVFFSNRQPDSPKNNPSLAALQTNFKSLEKNFLSLETKALTKTGGDIDLISKDIKTETGTSELSPVNKSQSFYCSSNSEIRSDFSKLKKQDVKADCSGEAVLKHDSDVEIIDNDEVSEKTYTDEQIRRLRRAIKTFFNKIDLETFDPHTTRLKDLRRKFEEKEQVVLNKDGRSYFKEITMRFMSIFNDFQLHKKKTRSNPPQDNKRKSSTLPSTPSTKQRKFTKPKQASASSHYEQCPICFGFFDRSLIEAHADACLGENPTSDIPSRSFSNEDTVVDCSPHSCLTPHEQERWIQFSKEPKPYHERLNTSSFEGCLLVRCPSCGLKYKSTEIEAHCDDCVEKVNSGCTRMGLYLVENKKKKMKDYVKNQKEKIAPNSIVID